jgi:hypothetical protein
MISGWRTHKIHMNKALIISSIAVLSATAGAQNRNAFKPMDAILGVTVTQSQTQQGTAYTVAMGPNATVIRDGKSHKLEVIEGFWILSDNGDSHGVQISLANYDNHSNNSGGTSAYGWQTQKKNGITSGESETFTFSSIGNPGAIDHFGFKVKASGVPAHIYQNAASVPEPATFAALGLGIAALRRRRKAAK